jgi:hypothetical protein
VGFDHCHDIDAVVLFMVMEIILHWTITLIAALMIAFVIAAALPPPLPAALLDDAIGGIVLPLSLSLLW